MIRCAMELLINSQTSSATLLKFGMDKWFHRTRYLECDYLFRLGLNLIHARKRSPSFWLVVVSKEACGAYDDNNGTNR